jgi:hypothetical protein
MDITEGGMVRVLPTGREPPAIPARSVQANRPRSRWKQHAW